MRSRALELSLAAVLTVLWTAAAVALAVWTDWHWTAWILLCALGVPWTLWLAGLGVWLDRHRR